MSQAKDLSDAVCIDQVLSVDMRVHTVSLHP